VKRSKTTTIEAALRILSQRADLQGDDGIATGACIEAAERLEEMRELLSEAASWVGGLPDDLVRRMLRAAK
jgi:hypothetical protein